VIRTNRGRAAFLGLALGDAFGRSLEFVRLPTVRTLRVDMSQPRWTDDTHMALYLAEACLGHGGAPLEEDRFGDLIGEQFSAWLDDPLTPSTAPGNTCLAGVRRWRQSRDWRTSGVAESDGCGAVMRICPLALTFEGDDLTRAARISAVITHGHPNAVAAAVAASHMLRWTLEEGRFGEVHVQRTIEYLRGPAKLAGTVDLALEEALLFARRDGAIWLDEASIAPGDGGWRAPSALGLAVAAALRWGVTPAGGVTVETFVQAVEKAARIEGDSDSVACLAGMFLGAAGGIEVLPTAWLSELPERARIEEIAERLVTRSAGAAAEETWVAVADLHGHRKHLEALLAHLDRQLGPYRLVLLGDYVDNGPDIPGLLDLLIQLRAERGDRFIAILGNHDLACLRVLGWPGRMPDPVWYQNWGHYWGWRGGPGSTPDAYGARSAAELHAKMPAAHVDFLRALPWCHDTGRYFFVHSGLEGGPIGPQRAALEAKELPAVHSYLPRAIRDKSLAIVSDDAWDRIVISAHTRAPADNVGRHRHAPHFMTEKRICLSGEIDQTGVLYAIMLPGREVVEVRQNLDVAIAANVRAGR
jgi:ADP-ribosylglycohydrolase